MGGEAEGRAHLSLDRSRRPASHVISIGVPLGGR